MYTCMKSDVISRLKISLLPWGSFPRNENCRAFELIFFALLVMFISVTFSPTKHLTNKRLSGKLYRYNYDNLYPLRTHYFLIIKYQKISFNIYSLDYKLILSKSVDLWKSKLQIEWKIKQIPPYYPKFVST